jgi:CTP:molybdopterin cytidylyltransferase MocA
MSEIRALVLAGSRAGERDPVALTAGVSHKALAPIAGVPMIERVLQALAACPLVGQIVVASEITGRLAELPTLRALALAERLQFCASQPSLSLSVAAVFEESGPPLLVTTADHPLLEADLVTEFLTAARASGADVAIGLVDQRLIEAAAPASRRTYLRFRDCAVSGANLFFFASPSALAAIRFWRRVETERKRPWRIAAAFGPGLLLGYALRRFNLAAACARAGRRIGVGVAPVLLSRAEAAIDVDRPEHLGLAERLLVARAQAGVSR